MGEIEIKIKDINIFLGFISGKTHEPTWNNFKSGNSKIQNRPRHKIDFIASGIYTLLYLYIKTSIDFVEVICVNFPALGIETLEYSGFENQLKKK